MSNSENPTPEMDDIFTEDVKLRIEETIRLAELNTSGEIRVHIEDDCPEDPLDRASYIFAELGMHKTELRNGVLIYLAVKDRKVAIIGDAGINVHMKAENWTSIYETMKSHFRNAEYEKGISSAIEIVGEKIRAFFPISSADRNELSNQVTTGTIKRK
jgi:uncharacterized membrane protein